MAEPMRASAGNFTDPAPSRRRAVGPQASNRIKTRSSASSRVSQHDVSTPPGGVRAGRGGHATESPPLHGGRAPGGMGFPSTSHSLRHDAAPGTSDPSFARPGSRGDPHDGSHLDDGGGDWDSDGAEDVGGYPPAGASSSVPSRASPAFARSSEYSLQLAVQMWLAEINPAYKKYAGAIVDNYDMRAGLEAVESESTSRAGCRHNGGGGPGWVAGIGRDAALVKLGFGTFLAFFIAYFPKIDL